MSHPDFGGDVNSPEEDVAALHRLLSDFREFVGAKPTSTVAVLCLDDLEEFTQDEELKEWARSIRTHMMNAARVLEDYMDTCQKDAGRLLCKRSRAQAVVEQMKVNANLVNATHPIKEP